MEPAYLPHHRVSWAWLDAHPMAYFVYGDNTIHRGRGGAAALRGHPHAIGFITKKYPNNNPTSFFTPSEYLPVYLGEMQRLQAFIQMGCEGEQFFIAPLGSNLANLHHIWELVIQPRLVVDLVEFWDRCVFLFPPPSSPEV